MTRMVELPTANVIVGERHRKDLGDIDALAASIAEAGLLHPIVVTERHQLIAGHRRLEAWKRLHNGRKPIPAHVVDSVDTARLLLVAERDENTCRKNFAPSEAVALGLALEAIEKPMAHERKAQGRPKKNLAKVSPSSESGTVTDLKDPRDGRVTSIVGPAVGMSSRTYEKAKAVVAAATDPELPVEARERARKAVETMDRTGKVSPSYEEMRTVSEWAGTRPPSASRPWTKPQSTRTRELIRTITILGESICDVVTTGYHATEEEKDGLDLAIKAVRKFRKSLDQ